MISAKTILRRKKWHLRGSGAPPRADVETETITIERSGVKRQTPWLKGRTATPDLPNALIDLAYGIPCNEFDRSH